MSNATSMNLMELENAVVNWAIERKIYCPENGSTVKDQVLKAMSEMGELADNALKGRDVEDDIGDVIVCLINVAKLSGLDLTTCLRRAYNDIKDRRGEMINGVFIKESDLEAYRRKMEIVNDC